MFSHIVIGMATDKKFIIAIFQHRDKTLNLQQAEYFLNSVTHEVVIGCVPEIMLATALKSRVRQRFYAVVAD